MQRERRVEHPTTGDARSGGDRAAKGTDPALELMDLIARSRGENDTESIMGRGMIEKDIDALIVWPHAAICSDGSLTSMHPRGRGAFTKVLRSYVREKKLGGIMFWELSGDTPDGELIAAISDGL